MKENQKYIVTVEGYTVDPAVSWANGQMPLAYQHRDELEAFLGVLTKHRLSGTCLEIGFENGGLSRNASVPDYND
ncbi:MAG: hypothetical protein KKF80_07250 [Candidatus Omnitrophica bacterium]|nr:hypothetical protein [Candidatus Omnitrophota bacterium]